MCPECTVCSANNPWILGKTQCCKRPDGKMDVQLLGKEGPCEQHPRPVLGELRLC